METVKNVWQWLIYSSADSQKFALTLKAGLAFLVFFGVDKALGDMIADNFVGFISSVLQTVAFAGLIWGGVRKVGITLKKDLKKAIKGY
jgi:hypothetical protein